MPYDENYVKPKSYFEMTKIDKESSLKIYKNSLSDLEESGLHLLIGDFFDVVALESQNIFPERDRLFQTFDGDSEMFDMRNFHLFDIFGLTEFLLDPFRDREPLNVTKIIFLFRCPK